MPHRRFHSRAALALALAAGLLVSACAGAPPPGNAAAQGNDHRTAETGFGLGPENFRSNGGAFGPDQLSK